MPSEDDSRNVWRQYIPDNYWPSFMTKPVKYIRENVILPLRQKEQQVYYHKRFDRVPTIDQCEIDDPLCRYEANVQLQRDKLVDTNIVKILRMRLTECNTYWGPDAITKCQKEMKTWEDNMQNFFIRYGESGFQMDTLELYMKQKHRMIWLRRRQENGEPDADYRD